MPVLPCEPAPVNEGELPPGYAVLLAEREQPCTEACPRLLRLSQARGFLSNVADNVGQETMMGA